MQKRCLFILLTITVIQTVSSYATEPARYNANLELLFIPQVKIDDQTYILGVLNLKRNGEYHVNGLTKLPPEQAELVDKINSVPCGPADNLGKLAAQNAYIDGHISYCLVNTPTTTVEGGKIYHYLFIENGIAQVITDVRGDTFAGCCDFLRSMTVDTMQFGYQSRRGFIAQTSLAEIDLNREYILKLSAENAKQIDF